MALGLQPRAADSREVRGIEVIAVIDDDGLWDTDTVTPSDGELTRILESWTSPKAGSFRQILDSQQDTGAVGEHV